MPVALTCPFTQMLMMGVGAAFRQAVRPWYLRVTPEPGPVAVEHNPANTIDPRRCRLYDLLCDGQVSFFAELTFRHARVLSQSLLVSLIEIGTAVDCVP
jgi:hypothetical protein